MLTNLRLSIHLRRYTCYHRASRQSNGFATVLSVKRSSAQRRRLAMIPNEPPPHRRGIGADRPLGGGSSNLADAASHLLGLATGTDSSLPSDGADAASHLLCLAAGKGSSLPFDGVDSPGGDDDLFNYSSDSNKDDDGSMIGGYV